MKFTNTQPGPRGVNAISGPVLVDPGQTVGAEVYAREQQHIEAAAWFKVEGSYTDNPDASGPTLKAVAADTASELDGLKKQLAERDAEIEKLKATKADEPAKTPAEVLAMASNPDVQFMTFKSAAARLLGDKTPSKKDEIVAALEELATKP
ncbi:hypothetical protein ELI24_08920 [Rhizobium ruizarguesonis]|uniref:hypothetical protein n=1 Tax=Rhizobium ruizarguesonis TaxID=2081791 RepID=UPI0010316629|nr:hypothetical protein [Rhizobium ruizarguesonis]TAW01661.1 hypothetical protein ELI24_08920 [Rhizobium ruizarguesonis]